MYYIYYRYLIYVVFLYGATSAMLMAFEQENCRFSMLFQYQKTEVAKMDGTVSSRFAEMLDTSV